MRRGVRISLVTFVALVLLLLVLGIIARLLLRPDHVTDMVKGAIADAGLKLETSTPAKVSAVPKLAVELTGVQVLLPSGERVASADELRVVLPWSSVFARQPVVTRLELVAPTLDLAAFGIWQESRPSGAGGLPPLPEFHSGIDVSGGRIGNAGEVVIDQLDLELNRLQPGALSELVASARLADGRALAVELAAVPSQDQESIRLDKLDLALKSGKAQLVLAGELAWLGDASLAAKLAGNLSTGEGNYQVQLASAPRAGGGSMFSLRAAGDGLDLDASLAPVDTWNWWQAIAEGKTPKLALAPITGVLVKDELVLDSLHIKGLRIESPAPEAPAAAASAGP